MKRDWDLIRIVLKKIEGDDYSDIDGYDSEIVDNHVVLLAEAGLVKYEAQFEDGHIPLNFCRLTWDGHDFVESAIDDALYKRAIETARKGGGVTFEIVKTVIAELVKSALFRGA